MLKVGESCYVVTEVQASGRYANYQKGRGLVKFEGFFVLKESITKAKHILDAISQLTPVQKQFIGTMIDTEVAAGYFLVANKLSIKRWTAYVSVKMKYRGDIAHLAELVDSLPPGRSLNANTITHTQDLRWSKQFQGIVAFALLKAVRPYLHNEKSIIEVDCILKHGPRVSPDLPHPFETCGAIHVRRGVWHWPQIDDEIDDKPPHSE